MSLIDTTPTDTESDEIILGISDDAIDGMSDRQLLEAIMSYCISLDHRIAVIEDVGKQLGSAVAQFQNSPMASMFLNRMGM
jgi:hypothetical protein